MALVSRSGLLASEFVSDRLSAMAIEPGDDNEGTYELVSQPSARWRMLFAILVTNGLATGQMYVDAKFSS